MNMSVNLNKKLEKYYGYEYYLTHDNGGRSFCVYISQEQNDVLIYKSKSEENNKDIKNFSELVGKYKPQKVFIGKSPLSKQTIFSGGHGPCFDGNSILLKMDKKKYIFIGTEIYSFTSENEIVSFVSPVGNNDVPYPYAIDTKGNFYFLFNEYAVLKIDDVSKHGDPYDYLYFVTGNIGKVENIEWMYFGNNNEQYRINTSVDPEKKYNDLIKMFGSPIYIQYKNKSRIKVSKSQFIGLLKKYNKKVGLKPISGIEMVYKRMW